MVTWQPPITPKGIVRSYRIEYRSGNFTYHIDTTNTSIIINMLEIFTTYQIQVFAMTIAEGDGSDIVNVTTNEDGKSTCMHATFAIIICCQYHLQVSLQMWYKSNRSNKIIIGKIIIKCLGKFMDNQKFRD